MKKTPDYHIDINMASHRTDGLESAAFADNYNFYPTDGATLFQRSGDEYFHIMGGWDITAMPGVTACEGMEKLQPVTNWRGYCSKHNFAAGATDGRENGVAGIIFEKMNGSDKKAVNDKGDAGKNGIKNELLYGFKAYKGYFILGDYFVALGAGVTNMTPNIEGDIRTTIDQTSLVNNTYILNKGKKHALSLGDEVELKSNKSNPVWLVQEGKFAYTLLPEYTDKAKVSCEMKPTDWKKMNPSNKNTDKMSKEVKILRLWVNHGQTPVNDAYGYAVYTGKGMPQSVLPFEVMRNDIGVQAVRTKDKSIVQAVFYPGDAVLKYKDLTLSVSAPCAVMIQKLGGKYRISVTDATMNADLKSISVTLNGKAYELSLPTSMHCGNTVTQDFYI